MNDHRLPRAAIMRNITVNTISSSSGIFIGTNYAHGWSSHRKSNAGFGFASDCEIAHSMFIVYDDDFVDSPMTEQNALLIKERDSVETGQIDFQTVEVGSMVGNAAVNVGLNAQAGWSTFAKANMGQGNAAGLNRLEHNFNVVLDNDEVDAPTQQGLYSVGQMGKS